MAETYTIPSSSLGKVSRWWNAKKAAGQTVQPWELQQMYEGEMNALGNRQTANRGLTLSEANAEEAKRMNAINTGFTERNVTTSEANAAAARKTEQENIDRLARVDARQLEIDAYNQKTEADRTAEDKRRYEINIAQQAEDRDAASKGQLTSAVGQLGSTALLASMLSKPTPIYDAAGKIIGTEPGIISKAGSAIGDAVKGGYNKLFPTTPTPTTPTPPVTPTPTLPVTPTPATTPLPMTDAAADAAAGYGGAGEGIGTGVEAGVNLAPETIQAMEGVGNVAFDAAAMDAAEASAGAAASAAGGVGAQETAIAAAKAAEAAAAQAAADEAATLASLNMGAEAGASTSMATLPVIGAAIMGAMLTKNAMSKYARGGSDEAGGLTGFLANSSQHPVAAGFNPPSSLVDAGIIDPDTGVGKVLNFPGKVEEKVMDWLGGGCIIVTACTSPDSEEVNISREYRDQYLTPEQLRGYYMIAEKVVPMIHRFKIVKWIMKKALVDNLIAYGRHALRMGPYPGPVSIAVTRSFLALCKAVGSRRPSFVRCNGEVV